MNEQPTSKMSFKGDWGCCPNKQIEKIARREICENEQSDSTLHCLRTCKTLKKGFQSLDFNNLMATEELNLIFRDKYWRSPSFLVEFERKSAIM